MERKENMKEMLLLLFCLFSTASIVLFKYAFERIGFEFSTSFLMRWLTNPLIIIAFILAIACRFIFYSLLNYYPSSIVPLLTSASLVTTVIACSILFNEPLTSQQLLGAILIVLGIQLVGV